MSNTNNPTHSEEQKQVPPLIIIKVLSSGKTHILKALEPTSNTESALKVFSKDSASFYAFNRERDFLKELQHPNIIQYISQAKMNIADEEKDVIVLEYAPYGDIYGLLSSKHFNDECIIRHFFQELIAGIEYLHSKKIAHFDIKPENLLLGRDYILKIADFDHAQTPETFQNIISGSTGYRAPEVLEEKCVDIFAADIYSAGITLFAMIAKELPFVEKQDEEGRVVLEGSEVFYRENQAFWRKRVAKHASPILFDVNFQALINGMLAKDPKRRFTMPQIKTSIWFTGHTYSNTIFVSKMNKILRQKV